MPPPSTSPTAQPLPGWALGPFSRAADQPILSAAPDTPFDCPLFGRLAWEAKDVFNPAAIVRDNHVCLLYRAEDNVGPFAGVSRIGLATSSDGLHFHRHPLPVLFPTSSADPLHAIEAPGGCEDPRVVERDDGTYILTYTAFDGARARLVVASSTDLLTWTRHGPAFRGTPYEHAWSKSGSILTSPRGGRLIATQVEGRYWMFWGESSVFAATSPDLIRWTPVEFHEAIHRRIEHLGGANYRSHVERSVSTLLPLANRRRKSFDSALCEPGPPAVLTSRGIVLLYNGRNAPPPEGTDTLPPDAYAVGQLLIDAADPTVIIARLPTPVLEPKLTWETRGQFTGGTTFAEGLVIHQDQWLLYYGAADSSIGVATAPFSPSHPR